MMSQNAEKDKVTYFEKLKNCMFIVYYIANNKSHVYSSVQMFFLFSCEQPTFQGISNHILQYMYISNVLSYNM